VRAAVRRPILVASVLAVGTPLIPGRGAADAQAPPTPSMSGAPLEQFVPSSAGLFVSTPKLADLDRGLRRTHAWRLGSVLTGGPNEDAEPPDIPAVLSRLLGARVPIDADDLAARELAFAARTWPDFTGSVLLVRAPEDDLLDRWFPATRRSRSDSGPIVHSFRTDDGLIVIRRGDVVAMGRYVGRDSLIVPVMALLRGASKESLADSSAFQRLRRHLPPRALADVRVVRPPTTPRGLRGSLAFLPRIDQAAISVYENDGRIELAVRGAVADPVATEGRLPTATVERLLGLPRTTLVATATTLDFAGLADAAAKSDSSDLTHRLWNLLASLRRLGATPKPDLPTLGPSVIAVWDQDLSGDGTTPQAAVLLQCDDARAMSEEVARIADNALRVLAAIEPGLPSEALTIDEHRHLGVRIQSVPLGRALADSRLAVTGLLSGLEPAWAASGDWLIVALGRVHLERILDARFGLVPTLGLIEDARALRRSPTRQTWVFAMQGEQAADLMDRWLAEASVASHSILAPAWWDRIVATEADRRLGISLQPDEQTGFVRVEDTVAGGPADGRIGKGDRVIAVNGTVLDLARPAEDLRDRWLRAEPETELMLRVLRGGRGVDVPVPSPAAADGVLATQFQPLEAVRELASLARAVPFATFVAYATDERNYSARMTLRLFTPEAAPRAVGP